MNGQPVTEQELAQMLKAREAQKVRSSRYYYRHREALLAKQKVVRDAKLAAAAGAEFDASQHLSVAEKRKKKMEELGIIEKAEASGV